MANVVVNTANVATAYSSRVIAQAELMEVMRPLIGKEDNKNSFIYKAPEKFRKGGTCRVPLRKAVTTAALEDGATYEGQGQKSLMSETDITLNERGQVFGGFSTYEERQTVVNLREEHTQEAEYWWAQDFDKHIIEAIDLATTSLPAQAGRAASQYNVYYCGHADGWDSMDETHKITGQEISRAKLYFMQQRGIRPAEIAPGYNGFILFLTGEATLALGWEEKFRTELVNALPRNEDHIFMKGRGLNPWGYWDGVYIISDIRPVYGSTDFTFLQTENVTDGDFQRFEGIFLGAQGIAFHEWKPVTWFERVWDHGRKYEVSVSGEWAVAKTVIDLNATLGGGTDRDYGIGYLCGTAPLVN